jgi:diguanylate cyclase (GGDEF)-like protein/PAS domain S-box-containing protein
VAANRTSDAARLTVPAILDSLRDAVLVIDAETFALLDVNQAACDLSGYSRAELLRMTAAELRVPEQRDSLRDTIGAALSRGGAAQPYLVTWLRKNGARLPIEFVNRRLDVGGRAIVVACGRDIGERMAWEASVRAAEERFADVLDHAPLAVYLKDSQRRFTHVNREYARWLKLAPGQIVGRTVDDLFPPSEAQRFNEHDRAVLSSGIPSIIEGTPVLPDGMRSVVTVKFPLRDPNGAISGVGSISSDVTSLRQAQRQLEEFFTLSSDILVVFDPDGRFERFNPALERALGYTAEELRALSPLALVHPDDRALMPTARTAFDASEQGYHLEVRYRHKSGQYRWLDWTGAPLSADGRRYASARDITERKRLQAEAETHALQQAALSNLSRLALADISVSELLAEAARLTTEALSADAGAVLELTADARLLVRAAVGMPRSLTEMPVANASLGGYALEKDATVIAADLASGERFPRSAALASLGAASGMAAPLRVSSGHFGVLEVFACTPRAFTLEDATFLASIASVLSSALERDRALQALRSSEEEYRRIFENAAEGIFQTDGRGGLRVVNSAAAHMLGYASSENLLASVTNVGQQLAADSERFEALQRQLLAAGAAPGVDARMRRLDGSLVDVRLNARVTTEADGSKSVLVLAADVTAERAARRGLLESEERYRRIFEDANEGIYQTDGANRFTLMNRAMATILGYSAPQEAIDAISDITDVFAERERRVQLLAALAEHGAVQGEEIRVRRRDGTIAITSLNARVVEDAAGNRCVCGVCNDVTAERAALEALKSSEEQYRRIVESTSEGVWMADARAVTTFVNARMAAILGYDRAEIIGRPVRMFMDAEGRRQMRAVLARRRNGVRERHEFRFVHRDGHDVWVEVSATPLFEEGVFAGSLALVRDLTALREAEQYKHRALHDGLTGLANRALFDEHLDQALRAATRRGEPLAVLQLDLDGFKKVNDTYGHHTGDLLLQRVAERLRRAVRESDTVARLGGDEFAVLLPNTDATRARQVAEKLIKSVQRPVTLEAGSIAVGLSAGVSAFPAHGHSAALLLRRADTAMYAAKRRRSGAATWSSGLESSLPRAS